MKKRTVRQELSYLYLMELLDAILLWLLYFSRTNAATRFAFSNAVIYCPLFVLSLILIEGSFYWFNCLMRAEKKKSLSTRRIAQIYQVLKVVNYVFIMLCIPVFFFARNGNKMVTALGILIWLFSIIELVNYFYYRLSYYTKSGWGLQVIMPLKRLLSGRAVKSQIAKDILLYRKKV